MANNRMFLICNVCLPPGTEKWPAPGDSAMLHVAKWYPSSPWYSPRPEFLGDRIQKFLEFHMHPEIHPAGEENPVRLEYETWVRDMPATKRWSPDD